MLSNDGSLFGVFNWMPDAILEVLYKIFARDMIDHISPSRFPYEAYDYYAFTLGVRIEPSQLKK